MNVLLERLAQLREQQKETNLSSRCDSEEALLATSLETYLLMYTKAKHHMYISYMDGAKQVAKWLSPIDISAGSKLDVATIKRDIWISSYETNELASILVEANSTSSDSFNTKLTKRKQTEVLICLTLRQLMKEGKI